MKYCKVDKEFKWVGEGFGQGFSSQRRRKIQYESFKIGDLKVNIGNFVLVRNDDALDPEDIMSCYVAQVKELFDTGEETDSHAAQVKWFSRIPELPNYAIKSLKTTTDVFEVVEERRSTWSDIIDAETVFQICEVLYLTLEADWETALLKYEDHPFPVFFCRYIFTGTTLLPALKSEPDTETLKDSKNQPSKSVVSVSKTDKKSKKEVTPKKNSTSNEKKKAMYKAALTGNPDFPKVVIKRIDDRILESKNGSVRVFVADSSVETIDDVTDKLFKKLNLEKDSRHNYENDLKNCPVIHNLKIKDKTSADQKHLTPTKSVKNEPDTEPDFQPENSRTSKSRKSTAIQKDVCPLNIKMLKEEYSVRSSPRKKTPSKNDIKCVTPPKKIRFSKELDVTESFLKLNLERDDEYENISEKRPIIHSLKSEDSISVEQNCTPTKSILKQSCTKSDLHSQHSRIPKARKSITFQDDSCSASVKSGKKESPVKSPRKSMTFQEDIYLPTIKSVKEESCVRSSPRNKTPSKKDLLCVTPQKKAKFEEGGLDDFALTRSGRKVKAVNYSEQENLKNKAFSSYLEDSDSSEFSASDSSDSEESFTSLDSPLDDLCVSRKRSPKIKKPKKSSKSSTPRSTSNKVAVNLSIPERKTPLKVPKNVLEESRQRLHVSSVPTSLPCREEEYSDIYSFVKGCLCAQTGGCMYISGVPGTGKTATVHEVVRNLEEEKELGEVPIFTFIEVNGMWMTDPYQCYVHIFKSLTGKTIAPQQAADLIEKRFTQPGPKQESVVLLVDELDRLWTRKQTVMYNIFDWPSKKNSKLVVLAIANTMDLPERMMMNRISSRLGLTRKTFQPYNFKQLQEIIMSRIQELKVFDPDAVQLVSRKVAAVSGDARRALDICRFATEIVNMSQTPKKSKKILVGMEHVDTALQQMFSSPLISAIRASSRIAKFFFQCMLSEFTRTGIEETTLLKVYQQVVATCRFEGLQAPNSSDIFKICADLATSHLILVDNFRNDLHMKIRLNVSSDDVNYALTLN